MRTFRCCSLLLTLILPLDKVERRCFVQPCTEKQKSLVIGTSQGSFSLQCFLLSLYFLFSLSLLFDKIPVGRTQHLLFIAQDKDRTGSRRCCCFCASFHLVTKPLCYLFWVCFWTISGLVAPVLVSYSAWIRAVRSRLTAGWHLGASWPALFMYFW